MIIYCILILLLAFILVCYSTQKVIYIAHKKHLFDEPSEDRKIHLVRTPNLGGVAIFASFMFTFFLFLPFTNILHLNYIIASSVIIFILGVTDDLVGANPTKKIIAQLIVALIITGPAEFRFTSFYGLLGIDHISYEISMVVSVFFIMLIINAFNLIDGINCLAGSLGLFASLVFAYLFWRMQDTGFLFLAVAMSGCLLGFLVFNKTPAKIFMGDTGSLFMGFILAVFSIHFLELNRLNAIKIHSPHFQLAPAIVFSLLIIPVFDTFRVFSLRILKGRSPFAADRNHIHHRLIDISLSHMQSTGILLLINTISFLLVLSLGSLNNEMIIAIVSAFILLSNWLLCHRFTQKINRPQSLNQPYTDLAAY